MTRFAIAVLALLAGCCLAQHGHDPFSGSGCNCSAFCAGSCAINASKPSKRTMYRMTPLDVDGVADKNTGDAPGDTSYVIERRTAAFDCRKDPGSFQCANLVVKGDDPDSTDLVIEFQVENDGQWGPYLYCNPLDDKHPERPWNCSTSLPNGPGPPPHYPESCAATYDGYATFCSAVKPDSVVAGVTLGGCCAAAAAAHAQSYAYHTSNSSCELHAHFRFNLFACADGVLGLLKGPPGPPTCQCPRVFASVGRENLTASGSHGGGGGGGAGGEWYSLPHQGMCAPGGGVGDGSGCSWSVVGKPHAVNASCVYDCIDAHVEAANATGFAPCPKNAGGGGGLNRTSDCYSECYSHTTDQMSPTDLTAPWKSAFGGKHPCPTVDIPSQRALAALAR